MDTVLFRQNTEHAAGAIGADLAQDLLRQSARLRRLARSAAEDVVHDELVELANKCDAAAATIIHYWRGRAVELSSTVAATTVAASR